LQLLRGKLGDDKLSLEEIQAISSHLLANVPQFEEILRKSSPRNADAKLLKEELQVLLTHSQVIAAERSSDDGMISRKQSSEEDTLFRRGESTNRCVLVLSGKVVVYAGRDEFRSELGPWSLIGIDALAQDSFVPDYSASVLSESIRYVIITKESLRALADGRPLKPERRRGSATAATTTSKAIPSIMGTNASASMRLRSKGATQPQVTQNFTKESEVVDNPMWPSSISPLSVENTSLVTGTGRRGDISINQDYSLLDSV
jgi:CRP-like cAMP-binding protein